MAEYSTNNVTLETILSPNIPKPDTQVSLPISIYKKRLQNLRGSMIERNIDTIVIYADREHYANFTYFAGFDPRFEEALLVIHTENPSYVFLGNECYSMYSLMNIPVEPIMCQQLSLPDQPTDKLRSMKELFESAKISNGMKVGIIGWKSPNYGADFTFCVPHYIVNAIISVVGAEDKVINATAILVNPDNGLRIINNADEISCFEYGAAYSSIGVNNALNHLEIGMTELEVAKYLDSMGLPQSCYPMVASGERTAMGLISPSDKKIRENDSFNISMGLRGGLTCRNGYIARNPAHLPENIQSYIENIAKPYYAAIASWYSTVAIDVTGGEIYTLIQKLIPKETFGWVLNPGHFIAEEEWLSSPVFPDSEYKFRSGQIIQMDIIPAVEGYVSPSAEDGICLADENLREEIKIKYPKVWERMQMRRNYVENVLGISLAVEVLPMSDTVGYVTPLLLNRSIGFKITT